jgi:hypothetical protein
VSIERECALCHAPIPPRPLQDRDLVRVCGVACARALYRAEHADDAPEVEGDAMAAPAPEVVAPDAKSPSFLDHLIALRDGAAKPTP